MLSQCVLNCLHGAAGWRTPVHSSLGIDSPTIQRAIKKGRGDAAVLVGSGSNDGSGSSAALEIGAVV